jgi:hypothetical protein
MSNRSVELTQQQRKQRKVLKALVAEAWGVLSKHDFSAAKRIVGRAATVAHGLHMDLARAGNEPQHHAYMIKNRGMPPSEPEFYRHLHPLDDLVAWLYGRAKKDPIDQTLGLTFMVEIACRRWRHPDVYTFERTQDGWNISAVGIGGRCDRSGHPYLFKNLHQDYIEHPSSLGSWLERLWGMAENGLSPRRLDRGLQDLAKWISTVECSAPTRGIWKPGGIRDPSR